MPNEKILEKNFIAMEELSCPSDYKLLKNTYILHLTGGYHFFNHRCLPNKNIKKINGKTLLEITIDLAKKVKFIKKIVISTDSKKYANISKKKEYQFLF